MPFAYFDRLSPARQRIYLRSDAIDQVALPAGADFTAVVGALGQALAAQERARAERASRQLLGGLCASMAVPPLAVKVLTVRPSGDWGELHGLYEPVGGGRRRALVTLWMRTAARQQVVAFRTFLRTLLHEFCHHLDYELYGLPETFHTEGFYKRESQLLARLLPPAGPAGPG